MASWQGVRKPIYLLRRSPQQGVGRKDRDPDDEHRPMSSSHVALPHAFFMLRPPASLWGQSAHSNETAATNLPLSWSEQL
jgi:hypothetical protein